jgi:hypothetical protein
VPHAWVWDPLGEYGSVCDRTWEDLRVFAAAIADGASLAPRECFQLPIEQFDSLAALALLCWAHRKSEAHGLFFVIEEIDQLCTASHASTFLRELIRRGRNAHVDVLAVSKRFADIPKDLAAQAHAANLFGTGEPNDRAVIEARFNADVARRVRELTGRTGEFVRHHVRT